MKYIESVGKKGFLTFTINGKLLYSNYEPQKEAAQYLAQTKHFKKYVITLCGYDYIDRVLNDIPEVLQILSFDPDDFPVTHHSEKVIRFNDLEKLKKYILVNNINSSDVSFVTWPPLFETDSERYVNYLSELKHLFIKSTLSNINQNTFEKLEIANIRKNIKILDTIKILSNEILDTLPPVIVVASGNSLKNEIALLKKLHNKAIIIAYASALPYLDKENIHPDYTIAVDPGYGTFYHLNKYKGKTSLITTLSITPSALRLTNYNFIFFNYGSSIEAHIFNSMNVMTSPPEGSVAFNLFRILNKIGCRKILLFGQDFCFHANRSHISGGLFENEFISRSSYYTTYESLVFGHDASQLKTYIHDGEKQLTTTTPLSIYYKHFIDKIGEFPVFIAENSFNRYNGKIETIATSALLQLPDITDRSILPVKDFFIKKDSIE